nr:NKY-1 [Urechis unicinctus]
MYISVCGVSKCQPPHRATMKTQTHQYCNQSAGKMIISLALLAVALVQGSSASPVHRPSSSESVYQLLQEIRDLLHSDMVANQLLRDEALSKNVGNNFDAEGYQPEEENVGHFNQKRNSFWQSMGGPLPVRTRFVSFGSRLEPDQDRSNSASNSMKTMRYGKKR